MRLDEPIAGEVRRLLDPVTLMLASLIFLVGVIPFGAALVLYQIQSRAELAEAEASAHKTATLLMRSFEQVVEPIDALLQNFAKGYDSRWTPQETYEALRSFTLPAAVVQLGVTDAAGLLVASSLAPPGPPAVDLSDREHIRVQMGRAPAKADLFISKPVLGRVSNEWTIQLTRPLGDAHGHFAGVVVASYAISDFIDFYKQLRIEDHMVIALVGLDGIVRARAAGQTSFGDDASKSPAFRAVMEHKQIQYAFTSPFDGVERVGYMIRSSRYPIIVLVAYSLAYVRQQSADFRTAIWGTALGLSAALLIVVMLGGRYLKLQRRLKAREVQALARQREADVLDAISRVPGIAVMHVTADGATAVGGASSGPLGPILRSFLRSSRFRTLAAGLEEPRLRNEHLSDGTRELEVEMVVAPLAGIDDEPAGMTRKDLVVFAMDQTERRLEENKLYQMSKLASLGEVATGLAHEINQPLGVIRLAASNALNGMKAGLPKEHLAAKLERIIQQTARMSRIIDHMRIFGRKSEEQFQPSHPLDAINGALQIVGAHFRLENIELRQHHEGALPQVLCRQDQLEQVLINLLQNARDAVNARRARSGADVPGRILVRTSFETRPGLTPMVRIDVADNGGGIPADLMGRVFQPFFTTKPPGKGTGLGLSVSFGIVRDHQGSLCVANDAEGAVFTIRLPAATPDASSAPDDLTAGILG
ncbi:ATP-binding protein [Xanthobacter sp. AM11]|uniref:ATP-binding protein n=1 Tax=Xanthobacter sp. AM11 TaxID=3380643 RepID=UPI0039BFFAE1